MVSRIPARPTLVGLQNFTRLVAWLLNQLPSRHVSGVDARLDCVQDVASFLSMGTLAERTALVCGAKLPEDYPRIASIDPDWYRRSPTRNTVAEKNTAPTATPSSAPARVQSHS
jgi:hypothetical protein